MNTSIPRMCTVSHCREILAVGYEYLRCERHRIQNRHHSKLKRVRDKDAKAQALEGWFATLNSAASNTQLYSSPPETYEQPSEPPTPAMFEEGSSGQNSATVPLVEMLRMDEQKRSSAVDLNIVEPQVLVFGVPPAARGVRRTNHICSIKGCHNLLSPSTPWKMCDDCRAHERTVRKIRALRESGVMVEPLPPRLPPKERKEKQVKENKAKCRKKDNTQDLGSPESSPDPDEQGGDDSGIVFMDPVLLGEEDEAPEVSLQSRNPILYSHPSSLPDRKHRLSPSSWLTRKEIYRTSLEQYSQQSSLLKTLSRARLQCRKLHFRRQTR